jgi:hypothetical protein
VFPFFADRLFCLLALDIVTHKEKRLTPHSAIKLNVSLIVSSGAGFASFTRTYMPALSSVAGSLFNMGSKIRDSEAALAKPEKNYVQSEKNSNYANSDKAPSPSMADDISLDHSPR